jgi:O-antigen/teichoic acid export membrane protein
MLRKYFKNAGLLAMTENLLLLKGLVLMPFLTRHFGPINYGAWSQITVLIATISPFVFWGTGSAVTRFLPGLELEKQKGYFSAWLAFLFVMALILCLPFFLFGDSISQFFLGGDGQYFTLLPLAGAWLIVSSMTNAARSWFQVQNNAKWWSVWNILDAIFYIIAVTIMLTSGGEVYELIVYTLIGNTTLLLMILGVILWKYGLSIPNFSLLPAFLKFGLPLVPISFAAWALNYVDRVFLVQFSTLEEVGIYSVAYSTAYHIIPLLMRPWRTMFANSAAELYNQNKKDTLQRLFERSVGLSFALAIPGAVGLFLVGRPILTILATPDFARGASILLFVSLGYIFLVLSSYYEIGLGLVHKQYLTNWIYGIALITNLVLNFLLIPRWTILGASIATCISYAVLLLGAMLLATKYGLFRIDLRYIYKVLFSTTVMGVAVYFAHLAIGDSIQLPVLLIGLLILIGSGVYGTCLWISGVLSRKEISLALSLIRR